MRTKLVVLNQQRFIPSFMLSALYCAKDIYSKVYYVNTKYPTNADVFRDYDNIIFRSPSWLVSSCGVVLAFFRLFKTEIRKDLFNCLKNKGFNFTVLKYFFVEQYVHVRLYASADSILKHNDDSDCCVISTWLSACSYTVAELKRKHPSISATSLAHSYEVLIERNPYVPYQHVLFKHNNLDAVFFISHTIRKMYLQGVGGLPAPLEEKTHVCYLGSYKEQSSDKNQYVKSVFNVCSCSSIIPLKRVSLLLDSLNDWSLCKLRWTHIGDGPMIKDLKERAILLMNNNPKVEIRFLGRIPNSDVKKYYADNPVDLFVNLSVIEGLPISIMEAISYGIPVLATDVGGTKEIVTPEVGFLLDPVLSADDVRKALETFFLLPVEQKDALRESAMLFWEQNFNADHNITKLFSQIQLL